MAVVTNLKSSQYLQGEWHGATSHPVSTVAQDARDYIRTRGISVATFSKSAGVGRSLMSRLVNGHLEDFQAKIFWGSAAALKDGGEDDLETWKKNAGERIAERRDYLGHARKQLAGLAGVHPTVVTNVETGKNFKISSIFALSLTLRMPWQDILNYRDISAQSMPLQSVETPTQRILQDVDIYIRTHGLTPFGFERLAGLEQSLAQYSASANMQSKGLWKLLKGIGRIQDDDLNVWTKKVKDRIRERQQALGYTNKYLAECTGIDETNISRLLNNGGFRINSIALLADALEISLENFLYDRGLLVVTAVSSEIENDDLESGFDLNDFMADERTYKKGQKLLMDHAEIDACKGDLEALKDLAHEKYKGVARYFHPDTAGNYPVNDYPDKKALVRMKVDWEGLQDTLQWFGDLKRFPLAKYKRKVVDIGVSLHAERYGYEDFGSGYQTAWDQYNYG